MVLTEFTEMSLPIDIPWKRIGVSKDMIDPAAGDLNFPEKWRSSMSVFYHEPTEVPPEYCDRKITYLKIVCTITNYQLSGDDVTILDELRKRYGEFYAWKNFQSNVTQSYPCYGALLQVAAFPNPADSVELHDFPYVSAFQPRKREMYEVATESGEVGSQSATKINVGKRATTTDSTETFDVEEGSSNSSSGSALFGLGSGSTSSSVEGQWGTIDRDERQDQNLTTTDSSREKRESHAYTTNISQLYTLLQGYHLGTNRALFFMEPRPHIQDSKFTFVRGLRRLEGIQEFLLIVDRPASVPGLCIEVALETAHAYLWRFYQPRLIPLSDLYVSGNLNKTLAGRGLAVSDLPYYQYFYRLVETWNSFFPWVRFLAHEAAGSAAGYIPGQINQLLQAGTMTWQQWYDLQEVTGMLPEVGTEEIALIFEELETDAGWFFLTGRRLSSCATPSPTEDEEEGREVDREKSEEAHISTYDESPSVVFMEPYLGVPEAEAPWLRTEKGVGLNSIVQQLNETLWSSLGSTERFPYGEVSFLETDFILDDMAQFVRSLGKADIQDRHLEEVDSLQPFVERGLGRVSGVRSIIDLGTLPTSMIARDLDVTDVEARKIRRDLLTTALEELDADSISPEVTPENPIMERFAVEFPPDKLRDLERSSRFVEDGPTIAENGTATPEVGWALSQLSRALLRTLGVRR